MTEFTSSLQRAAAISKTTNPTTTTTSNPNKEPKNTKTGAFESSFHGLDLSEFGNTTTTPSSSSSSSATTTVTTKPGQPSASSQLLKRIELESEQILANETEEAILFEQARRVASKREEALRIQKTNEAEKRQNGVGKDAELYSALVSMHSGDWNGGKSENRRRMVGGGGVKSGGGGGKKRHAVKRVRRSKCRLGKK